MHFSVIIPTYNRFDKLQRVLASLEKQTVGQKNFEVIVINDGSNRPEYQNIAEIPNRFNLNFVLREQLNKGAGQARNEGLKIATGVYVIFLGDDTIADEHLLEEHLNFHRKYPDCCVLGFIDWYKELEINQLMRIIAPYGEQFDYRIKNFLNCGYRHFYTSNISIERAVLSGLLFRPEFIGCNWEDIDFGYKLEKRGVKIVYNKNAIVYHDHYYELDDFLRRQRSVGKNKKIFLKINPDLNNLWSNKFILRFILLKDHVAIILGHVFSRNMVIKALIEMEWIRAFLTTS